MKIENTVRMPSIEELEACLSKTSLRTDRGTIILYLSVMVYTLILSSITIFKHYAFKTYAWDLGIFTQSLWTTLNGGGFFNHTPELFINPSGSFFGVHFSPILFLVLPLYWIIQTPETLLVLQSFILALAALPIYKLAKKYAGGRIVGLSFAIAYLMFPAIHFVNLYDFHVQAFLPLFFAYTIYYITEENWPRYFLFVFLSLMCEEHVAQIIFFIGVYVLWKYRTCVISAIKSKEILEKKLLIPLITMVFSIVWFLFTLWQRATFFPTNPETLEAFLGSGNFAILGAKNPLEIPFLILLRPLNVVQAIMYDWHLKLLYVVLVFGPLAFFSLKAPSALIPTVPWLGFSFLSQAVCHHALGHQYEAYIVSFIFTAAIFAFRKKFSTKQGLKGVKGSVKIVMVFSLIFFFGASPFGPVFNVLFPDYTPIYIGEHERLLSEVLDIVPYNASILTQDNLFVHISHRTNAYVVPNRFLESEIHNIAVNFVNQTMDEVEYILVDNKTDPIATELILSLLETKTQFILLISKDNSTILLYGRKP